MSQVAAGFLYYGLFLCVFLWMRYMGVSRDGAMFCVVLMTLCQILAKPNRE